MVVSVRTPLPGTAIDKPWHSRGANTIKSVHPIILATIK